MKSNVVKTMRTGNIGFRLNGVWHSGARTDNSDRIRNSGLRFSYSARSNVNSVVGFRFVNGGCRGGSFSSAGYEGYRCARRINSDSNRGYGNVGFRSEWCR